MTLWRTEQALNNGSEVVIHYITEPESLQPRSEDEPRAVAMNTRVIAAQGCHACEGRLSHFEERTKFTLLRPATEEEEVAVILGMVTPEDGL